MAGVKARARPRKRSVNFRRLYWLIIREAALRVLAPDVERLDFQTPLRAQLARRPSDRLRVVVGLVLSLHPERRVWPMRPA